MATINLYFTDPNKANDNKTIPELVPLEVALSIFERLSLQDIFNCSRASRGLSELASNDRIWKPIAKLVGIRVEQLPYETEPAVTSGFKKAVGERVLELKASVAGADPLLHAEVKSADEFDIEFFRGADQRMLIGEINEKHRLHVCLDGGVWAHLFLRRIGMSTFEKMQEYATVLKEKYGRGKTWHIIAQEYVREGHFTEALTIINAHLNTKYESSERNNLFYSMVSHFSMAGDFVNAIDYLKKMQSYESYDREDTECPNIILGYAKQKRNFAVVLEMLTEEVVPKSERISNILSLIRVYIKERDYQKARDLLQQFAAEIEKSSNEFEIYELIKIYVELGSNQKAWDLAHAHQKDDLIFAILRNAFTAQNLLAEAEKAQALIKLRE